MDGNIHPDLESTYEKFPQGIQAYFLKQEHHHNMQFINTVCEHVLLVS